MNLFKVSIQILTEEILSFEFCYKIRVCNAEDQKISIFIFLHNYFFIYTFYTIMCLDYLFLITLAGTPAATTWSNIFEVTTAFAPITAPSPIIVPALTIT